MAMEEAILADGAEVPAGGLDLARDPMPLPGETAAGVRAAAEPEAAAGSRRRVQAARRRSTRRIARVRGPAAARRGRDDGDDDRRPRPRRQARGPRAPVRRRSSASSPPRRCSGDPGAMRRLGRELSRLEPVVAAYRELVDVRAQLGGARQHARRRAGRGHQDAWRARRSPRWRRARRRLLDDLRVSLLPRDPNDDRNVIVEIRAGAGGEEAALFATELLRMYSRYAQEHRFGTDLMSLNETGIGGIKEAILEVTGDGAYSRLKFEGGVHRVQRVPRRSRAAASTRAPRPSSSCPRSTRSRSTSTRRRTSGSTSSGAPGRAASRSTRPTPPSGSRTSRRGWWSRSRTRRASTRTRPRRWPCCAPACTTWSSRSSARRRAPSAG